MDEALCYCLFVTLLPRHEGRPNGADHLAARRGCRRRGHPAVLPERLDAPPADRDGRVRRAVSHDPRRRIRLPAHGRVVGEPSAEEQPHGRRLQCGERKLHAGDPPDDERILRQPPRALFYYRKKWQSGWINVVNPFRATMVLGTPGSGKSYAIINNYIKQQIEKSFAMYIYDYKFPDLSEIAYNHLRQHLDAYPVKPQFFVINFDDPRRSHRCNPIHPDFMTDISDAYEAAYTILLNLNKSWIQKQGDFFVESPIILLAAIIWFLRIYEGGRYCTFPHAVEFLNRPYAQIFPILTSYDELANYLSPFMDAWEGGAQEQLQVRP